MRAARRDAARRSSDRMEYRIVEKIGVDRLPRRRKLHRSSRLAQSGASIFEQSSENANVVSPPFSRSSRLRLEFVLKHCQPWRPLNVELDLPSRNWHEKHERKREKIRAERSRETLGKSREMSQHSALSQSRSWLSCWKGNFYASLCRIVLQHEIHLTATVTISIETYREGIVHYFLIFDIVIMIAESL